MISVAGLSVEMEQKEFKASDFLKSELEFLFQQIASMSLENFNAIQIAPSVPMQGNSENKGQKIFVDKDSSSTNASKRFNTEFFTFVKDYKDFDGFKLSGTLPEEKIVQRIDFLSKPFVIFSEFPCIGTEGAI